jgi:pimeloyl-ACP methyl ester carboxylesterase
MVFYKIIFNLLRKITLFNAKLVERKITINYKTISYYKSKNINNSKTIILIHGLNDTKDTFLALIKELKGFNIIAIDLLGSGASYRDLNFNYSLNSQADFLQATISQIVNKEGISNFSLAGHSMGGGIALTIASKIKIEKLYLFAPYGIEAKEPKIKLRAKESGKDIWKNVCTIKKLIQILNDMYYKAPNIPNFILKIIVKNKCKNAKLESIKIDALVDNNLNIKDNLTNIAKNITTPTLIFAGEEDSITDISSAYLFKEAIANSKIYTYANCGHMVHIEMAKDVAKEINS